jgi:hypothetical protein
MVGLLGQIIPIGLLLALGPTRIMSTILLLTSARPMRNALAFLGGVASVYLVVGAITLLFFGRTLSDLNSGTIIIDAILIVAGVFLLVLAARSFFIAPDPDAPPPGWMQRITSISTGQAFLFGVILACSIRYLLIYLSGVALIYETGVSPSQGAIALLVLILLTLLCQILLVALYAVNSSRARAQLSALMEWLNQHNRVIMTALYLVLGVIFLVKGVNGLTHD